MAASSAERTRLHCKLRLGPEGSYRRFSIPFPLSYTALREACETCGLGHANGLVFADADNHAYALDSDTALQMAYRLRTGDKLQLFAASEIPLEQAVGAGAGEAHGAIVVGTPIGAPSTRSRGKCLAAVATAMLIFGLGVFAGEHAEMAMSVAVTMDPSVRRWYTNLLSAAVVNIALYALLMNSALTARLPASYQRRLRLLAAPVVLQCAWRGVFPSLYLQRFAFWDTPLNSILVDRTFAFVGEMSWNVALACCFCHLDTELHPDRNTARTSPSTGTGAVKAEGRGQAQGSASWVHKSAVAMVATYAVAEATSYYNTATENELWAAVEVLLDGSSQVLLLPATVSLFRALPSGKRLKSSAGVFLLAFAAQGLGLFGYNVLVDAPMYWRRYQADQAAHKQYLPFMQGLRDALVRRIPTQKLADWQQDMSWMVAYFWANPLGATFIAWAAPNIGPAAEQRDSSGDESDEGDCELTPLTHEGSSGAPCVASARGSVSLLAMDEQIPGMQKG